ncbi:MAG: hypothetical protein ABJG68_14980 [Crocinitomicaceae bacterium]
MNYTDIEVNDRDSFIKFTKELLENYRTQGEKWENNTLETFLEALSTYSEEIDGYYRNLHPERNHEEPSWKAFSEILSGAVIYE